LNYTRYADNLSFSGEMDRLAASKLREIVSRIVAEEGFNTDKTKLMGYGNRQTVTGVVVNETLGLSRQERRRLAEWRMRISPFMRFPSATSTLGSRRRPKLAY
jgi:retron-type reverse transcriptase